MSDVLISRPSHITSAYILLTKIWPSNYKGGCGLAKRLGLNHNTIFMAEGENRFGGIMSLATLTKPLNIIVMIQVTELSEGDSISQSQIQEKTELLY